MNMRNKVHTALFLIWLITMLSLFSPALVPSRQPMAQEAMVTGRFDTAAGVTLVFGTFRSAPLPVGTVPAVDGAVLGLLQSRGVGLTTLGWRFTGDSMGCQNGVVAGNVHSSSDPMLTAIRGAGQVLLIPVRFSCSTGGVYPIEVGVGEAVLLIHLGSPAPAGYFAPVDVIHWSGDNAAISSGMAGMNLMLE